MSAEEQSSGPLVPASPGRLAPVGAGSLAARGRGLLRNKDEAESWLRKGLEFQESAPADPWSRGPINPYADRIEARKLELPREHSAALSEAFRCFEKGNELDPSNPELIFWLAESYRVGSGVDKNEERSIELFRRAAELGHARAQTAMGDAYAQCGFSCLSKNEAEAARWYESAAQKGDEEALWMIVDYYQRGTGVKQEITAPRQAC